MRIKLFLVIAILSLFAINMFAQNDEDAVRLIRPTSYGSARAGAFNVAFYGLSDDYSALIFNPSGLALVGKNEISCGFGWTNNSTQANYLGNSTNFSSNNAYLTNIGLVAPFNTSLGKASVAISYTLDGNFDNNYKFSGFNPKSTLINSYTHNAGSDLTTNIPYQLYLSGYPNKNSSAISTPITDSLMQDAFIQEKGGMHTLSGGAGFDISKNVSVGFSISAKWGSYDYSKHYTESDIYNKYTSADTVYSYDSGTLTGAYVCDFKKLTLDETFNQDISGFTGAIGIMYHSDDNFRLGVSIKFPTAYHIEEDYSQNATADFDDPINGGSTNYKNSGSSSYDITTPFVFSLGMSYKYSNLIMTGGVEYQDAAQMEFSNASFDDSYLNELNRAIINDLTGQLSWGLGLEYEIPNSAVSVRASYQSTSSAYMNDIADATQKIISFGCGVLLAPNIRLDALLRSSTQTLTTNNYSNYSTSALDLGLDKQYYQYTYKSNPFSVALQISYRY